MKRNKRFLGKQMSNKNKLFMEFSKISKRRNFCLLLLAEIGIHLYLEKAYN